MVAPALHGATRPARACVRACVSVCMCARARDHFDRPINDSKEEEKEKKKKKKRKRKEKKRKEKKYQTE